MTTGNPLCMSAQAEERGFPVDYTIHPSVSNIEFVVR